MDGIREALQDMRRRLEVLERQDQALRAMIQSPTQVAADALRFRWLLAGNGYFLEEGNLCGTSPTSQEEQDEARAAIDEAMQEQDYLEALVIEK